MAAAQFSGMPADSAASKGGNEDESESVVEKKAVVEIVEDITSSPEVLETVECGCCFYDTVFQHMIQCPDGHVFCRQCLTRIAQEAIGGQGEAHLKCMAADCGIPFARDTLNANLSALIIQLLDERLQEDALSNAGLSNFVRCPSCNFGADVEDLKEQFFKCFNCLEETCIECHKERTEHEGMSCQQLENVDEVAMRTTEEERQTEAKCRRCPSCRVIVEKYAGCNKMMCRCGKSFCYLCRARDIGYEHYCEHVYDPPNQGCPEMCGKCRLFSDDGVNYQRPLENTQHRQIPREVPANSGRPPRDMLRIRTGLQPVTTYGERRDYIPRALRYTERLQAGTRNQPSQLSLESRKQVKTFKPEDEIVCEITKEHVKDVQELEFPTTSRNQNFSAMHGLKVSKDRLQTWEPRKAQRKDNYKNGKLDIDNSCCDSALITTERIERTATVRRYDKEETNGDGSPDKKARIAQSNECRKMINRRKAKACKHKWKPQKKGSVTVQRNDSVYQTWATYDASNTQIMDINESQCKLITQNSIEESDDDLFPPVTEPLKVPPVSHAPIPSFTPSDIRFNLSNLAEKEIRLRAEKEEALKELRERQDFEIRTQQALLKRQHEQQMLDLIHNYNVRQAELDALRTGTLENILSSMDSLLKITSAETI